MFARVAPQVDAVAMDLDTTGAVADEERPVHIVPRNIGGNALVSPQRKRRNNKAKK